MSALVGVPKLSVDHMNTTLRSRLATFIFSILVYFSLDYLIKSTSPVFIISGLIVGSQQLPYTRTLQ